jgi:methylated-DNA-[protein]-cysteine S-methyltransferase
MTTFAVVASPLGDLLLVGDDTALSGLYLPDHRRGPAVGSTWRRDDEACRQTAQQLSAYFAGERAALDVPVAAPAGSPFQRRVWEALREIPYGETRGYGGLAATLGAPGAARAVGAAVARNPVSIVVPCHRVVGSTGRLTGYAGGLAAKRWLLEHERAVQAALQR